MVNCLLQAQTAGAAGAYGGSIRVARKVAGSRGAQGICKGLSGHLAANGICFGSYEAVRRWFARDGKNTEDLAVRELMTADVT